MITKIDVFNAAAAIQEEIREMPLEHKKTHPPDALGEHYNCVLEVAKKVVPEIRHWPPPAEAHDRNQPNKYPTSLRYYEIGVCCGQIMLAVRPPGETPSIHQQLHH